MTPSATDLSAPREDEVDLIIIVEPKGDGSAEQRKSVKSSESSDFVFYSPGTFDADFELACAPGYQPTPAERAYVDRLGACISNLRPIDLPDDAKGDSDLLRRKEATRDDAFRELRREAEVFAKLTRGDERNKKAVSALHDTYRVVGAYEEREDRNNSIPFTVTPLASLDQPDRYYDLKISTRDVPIPPEKARLKIEIDSAVTVVKILFGEREKSGDWPRWLTSRAARVDRLQRRVNDYITQLAGIAKVGLTNMDATQAGFARDDLARFKREFTAREAGSVKNRYLRRLGSYSLLAALLMALGYAFARQAERGTIAHEFRNFFLLAIGTAIGTWLSFSLRRPILTFDDLAVLEEDRLDPSLRILFMIGLTTVVGLLFWTHAVSVGMGELQSRDILQGYGTGALLIGLLAGIAERVLGTVISRRATDLAVSLSSGRKSAPDGGAARPSS
jgi:hypothetical protein